MCGDNSLSFCLERPVAQVSMSYNRSSLSNFNHAREKLITWRLFMLAMRKVQLHGLVHYIKVQYHPLSYNCLRFFLSGLNSISTNIIKANHIFFRIIGRWNIKSNGSAISNTIYILNLEQQRKMLFLSTLILLPKLKYNATYCWSFH